MSFVKWKSISEKILLRAPSPGLFRPVTGAYASVPEVCKAAIREVDSVGPRPHQSQLYSRGHEVYRQLYPTLKPIYRLIQNLG